MSEKGAWQKPGNSFKKVEMVKKWEMQHRVKGQSKHEVVGDISRAISQEGWVREKIAVTWFVDLETSDVD